MSDPHFESGGCTTTLATDWGARVRHMLDRESEEYKQLYAMRTMVERINSQAEALDILHPKLRRGRAIANRNTLTYELINLRVLNRIRAAQECGRQLISTLPGSVGGREPIETDGGWRWRGPPVQVRRRG